MIDPAVRLRWAIVNDNLSVVTRIVHRYPDLLENPDPANGWTSLHYAGYHGHYLICVFLVNQGHDRDEISLDFMRNTPLHLAAQQNQEQTVHYLAQHLRRCLDWQNSDLETPLMVASRCGHQPCITLLLDFGADPDIPGLKGNRPIHIAAAYGHIKAIRTLVDRNADTASPNDLNFTPAKYSLTYQVLEYLQALIQEKKKHAARPAPSKQPSTNGSVTTSPQKSLPPPPKHANPSNGSPNMSPTSSFSSLNSLQSSTHVPTKQVAPSPLQHSTTILDVPMVAKPQYPYQQPLHKSPAQSLPSLAYSSSSSSTLTQASTTLTQSLSGTAAAPAHQRQPMAQYPAAPSPFLPSFAPANRGTPPNQPSEASSVSNLQSPPSTGDPNTASPGQRQESIEQPVFSSFSTRKSSSAALQQQPSSHQAKPQTSNFSMPKPSQPTSQDSSSSSSTTATSKPNKPPPVTRQKIPVTTYPSSHPYPPPPPQYNSMALSASSAASSGLKSDQPPGILQAILPMPAPGVQSPPQGVYKSPHLMGQKPSPPPPPQAPPAPPPPPQMHPNHAFNVAQYNTPSNGNGSNINSNGNNVTRKASLQSSASTTTLHSHYSTSSSSHPHAHPPPHHHLQQQQQQQQPPPPPPPAKPPHLHASPSPPPAVPPKPGLLSHPGHPPPPNHPNHHPGLNHHPSNHNLHSPNHSNNNNSQTRITSISQNPPNRNPPNRNPQNHMYGTTNGSATSLSSSSSPGPASGPGPNGPKPGHQRTRILDVNVSTGRRPSRP